MFSVAASFRGLGQRVSERGGIFNPDDVEKVTHKKYGIWDFYEAKNPELANVPARSKIETLMVLQKDFPYFVRMLRDVLSLPHCRYLLGCYVMLEILSGLLPSASLWYSGKLLAVVQDTIDSRTLDQRLLFTIAAGRVACEVSSLVVGRLKTRVTRPIRHHMNQFYSVHLYHGRARLDVPTFNDATVDRQFRQIGRGMNASTVWSTIQTTMTLFNFSVVLFSQVGVLMHILRGQRDGIVLTLLVFVTSITHFSSHWGDHKVGHSATWAATTKNEDYIRMEGLKQSITRSSHRHEIVAGEMGRCMLDEFARLVELLGVNAQDYIQVVRKYDHDERYFWQILRSSLKELPMIVFAVRAVQYPSSVPVSIASLNIINESMGSFASTVRGLLQGSRTIEANFERMRLLYKIVNIPNQVLDGQKPFPEETQSLARGISIEFRSVSFRYPGSDSWALKDVSFKIEAGQLCVIIGENGSGKSTVLKLIARIYDPEDGTILINNEDIRNFRLEHLRRAMSVLFQDYTHFPLNIKDNIGLGDPEHAHDEDAIRAAARLAGAEDFTLSKGADGYDTYLQRPVKDYYGGLPQGTKNLFGRKVNYTGIQRAGGIAGNVTGGFSGGQMQRLALSRTFMRSVASEESVGLLLFDEPSAVWILPPSMTCSRDCAGFEGARQWCSLPTGSGT